MSICPNYGLCVIFHMYVELHSFWRAPGLFLFGVSTCSFPHILLLVVLGSIERVWLIGFFFYPFNSFSQLASWSPIFDVNWLNCGSFPVICNLGIKHTNEIKANERPRSAILLRVTAVVLEGHSPTTGLSSLPPFPKRRPLLRGQGYWG